MATGRGAPTFFTSFLAGHLCTALGLLANLFAPWQTAWVLGVIASIALLTGACIYHRATAESSCAIPLWGTVWGS